MASRAQRIGRGKAALVEKIKDNVVNSLFAKHYRDEVYYTGDWKPVPEELASYSPEDLIDPERKKEVSDMCKRCNEAYGTNFTISGNGVVRMKPQLLSKSKLKAPVQPQVATQGEEEEDDDMDSVPVAPLVQQPLKPVGKNTMPANCPPPFVQPPPLSEEQVYERRFDSLMTQHYKDIRNAARDLADQMRAEGLEVPEGIPARGEGSSAKNADFIIRNTDP